MEADGSSNGSDSSDHPPSSPELDLFLSSLILGLLALVSVLFALYRCSGAAAERVQGFCGCRLRERCFWRRIPRRCCFWRSIPSLFGWRRVQEEGGAHIVDSSEPPREVGPPSSPAAEAEHPELFEIDLNEEQP